MTQPNILYVSEQNPTIEEPIVLEVMDTPNFPQEQEQPLEVTLELDFVPGAPKDVEDIVIEEEKEEVKDEQEVKDEESLDGWKIPLTKMVEWVDLKFKKIPKHSGNDIAGIERAVSFLKKVKNEVYSAMKNDLDEVLDSKLVEDICNKIEKGIDGLEDRKEKLSKKKKRADDISDRIKLIKEASSAMGVNGITVVAPIFISRIARILVNGHISAGHDMSDMFDKLIKKYDLDQREVAEVLELVSNMGYPLRMDRGYDLGEEVDAASSDNFDWAANYSDPSYINNKDQK
jgi:hypothetical protein